MKPPNRTAKDGSPYEHHDSTDRGPLMSLLGLEGAHLLVRMRDGRSFFVTVIRPAVRGSVLLDVWGVSRWLRVRVENIRHASPTGKLTWTREQAIRKAQREAHSKRGTES